MNTLSNDAQDDAFRAGAATAAAKGADVSEAMAIFNAWRKARSASPVEQSIEAFVNGPVVAGAMPVAHVPRPPAAPRPAGKLRTFTVTATAADGTILAYAVEADNYNAATKAARAQHAAEGHPKAATWKPRLA